MELKIQKFMTELREQYPKLSTEQIITLAQVEALLRISDTLSDVSGNGIDVLVNSGDTIDVKLR